MPTNQSLLHQVNTLPVPTGSLAIWSLGQAGLILKGGSTIAYIDPYLTGGVEIPGQPPKRGANRRFAPPILPAEVTNAQIVFCTHEHLDHTDPETMAPLAAASPSARFIGPSNSRDILLTCAIDEAHILVPETGKPYHEGDITFTAIPAAHYGLDYDPARGYRWLGFVITLNGVTLYHSGDTIWYDGLLDHLKPHTAPPNTIDITAIPVNGRDWVRDQRGIIGNFDAPEALELTAALNADVFLPLHNDLFSGNRVSPAILAEYQDRRFPFQKYHWLQPGELCYYVKP